MAATQITINGRTKLGFGWSHTPARNSFSIAADAEPTEFGTIKQLADELERVAKNHTGGVFWTWSLYIRVDGEWQRLGCDESRRILSGFYYHPEAVRHARRNGKQKAAWTCKL